MQDVTIHIKKLQTFLGPTRAGRRIKAGSAHVKNLVKMGRLDGIRTDLGWLIDPDSLERYERERDSSK